VTSQAVAATSTTEELLIEQMTTPDYGAGRKNRTWTIKNLHGMQSS
jgi:hypothetical protein